MAITFDAATFSAQSSSVTSISFTHTTAGSDRALFAGVAEGAGFTIDSATYAGVAMTRQWHVNDPTILTWSAGFSRANPASGANTLTVSFGGSTSGRVGAISLNGVDQTTPVGTPSTASGTTSPATVAVASAADDWVLDNVAADCAALAVGAGQTQRYNGAANGGGNLLMGGSTEPATGATTAMSWTLTTPSAWSIGGIAFKPAAIALEAPKLRTVQSNLRF